MAGTIAAIANNNEGIAGVAPEAKIVPVRVLSLRRLRLGHHRRYYLAAGGGVRGVPANQNPTQVINMSIGSEGTCTTRLPPGDCSRANKRGSIVVVAAG